jgi:hypothetical protein
VHCILALYVNNIVNNQEQYGQQNIVQACFQQHCYRLGVFCSVDEMVYCRIEKWKVNGKLGAQTEDEERSGRMSDITDISSWSMSVVVVNDSHY